MKPYLVKTPKLIQRMFPRPVWTYPKSSTAVYLTFDDGPIPEVTPWVLRELNKYNAKATFFCIGENIYKHPEVFNTIVTDGHAIGNHTYNHLNGRKTDALVYVENVVKVNELLEQIQNPTSSLVQSTSLFRPPYGRITARQSKLLEKKGYKIIMWDVLSGDFDTSLSEEKCLQNVKKYIRPSSIVVFHDSLKAQKKLKYVLPKVLEYISERGWNCTSIT